MRIYNVLTQGLSKNTIFVEESFSFLALIFQGFWLLYHRVWLPASIVLLIKYALFIALKNGYINDSLALGADFIIALIVAMFAKTWYIEKLRKNNYQLYSIIVAQNLDNAKLLFYQDASIKELENVRP